MTRIDAVRAANATDNIEQKKRIMDAYEAGCNSTRDSIVSYIYDYLTEEEDSYDYSRCVDKFRKEYADAFRKYLEGRDTSNEPKDRIIEGFLGTIDFDEFKYDSNLDWHLEEICGDSTVEFWGAKVGYGIDMTPVVNITVY